MKNNVITSLKQYARVSRTFPKKLITGTNARIRALVIPEGLDEESISSNSF